MVHCVRGSFVHGGTGQVRLTSPPSAATSPSISRSCSRSGSLMIFAASAASAASSDSRAAFWDCSAAARSRSACRRLSLSPSSMPPADVHPICGDVKPRMLNDGGKRCTAAYRS